ncbi:MAG: mannitol dehydrogenase family protein [Rhizobiaceae bacterium]
MSSSKRLTSLSGIAQRAVLPGYEPANHRSGIVHLGPGAFHRAHQAVYTDAALAASGGDWRITGISMRSRQVADALNQQNGLYTLLERGSIGSRARVIGSIEKVIALVDRPDAAMTALTDPATRIVSMTVTEKAYGIDRSANCADPEHPAVAADLIGLADLPGRDAPLARRPTGVLGLLVESLRQRRAKGLPAFTLLCCDNLPNNGALLKAGLLDFAHRLDPKLAEWIADNATFPSTMVDRITPASTDQTSATCQDWTGREDRACVETEEFSQWVIEDNFANGRPDWEAGGALFVADVAPFEKMKLRMLNGAHSMLAYAGYLCGRMYVRDVMAHPYLSRLVVRHMAAAAVTLKPLNGINYVDYAVQLNDRFKNPALAHETYQIAMDGTEKLPQRLLLPAVDALAAGQDVRPFAFAVAAWMRYCTGLSESGQYYALRDPREADIKKLLKPARTAREISRALHGMEGLFPQELKLDRGWREVVEEILALILLEGIETAMVQEASPT